MHFEGAGFLKTFFEKTKDMSPTERAKYLEEDEVGKQYSGKSRAFTVVSFDSSVGRAVDCSG